MIDDNASSPPPPPLLLPPVAATPASPLRSPAVTIWLGHPRRHFPSPTHADIHTGRTITHKATEIFVFPHTVVRNGVRGGDTHMLSLSLSEEEEEIVGHTITVKSVRISDFLSVYS